MAWYQPQNEIPPPKRGPSRLWLRGLIAGVLVVAGAIGVWFWFTPSSPSEETPVVFPKPKKVKTVRPTPVPRTAEPKREAIVPEKPKKLNFWEYPVSRTNELNAAQIRKWKGMNRAPAGITNNTSSVEAPPKYAIFKYRSENEIAALLTLRPGEGIVGTPTYGKWFEEDFLKACEEDVAILPEDTPEEAELKRAMNETKADIRKRVAEGEKVGDILLAARREHQELAMYKREIEGQLREIRKNANLTMQDIDDFVTAANKMLEQKGIAPISLSPITRRRLMHQRGLQIDGESVKKGNKK